MQTTPLAQQAIALLIRRLADPVEEVAEAALASLLAYGPHALTQVLDACAHPDADLASRALRWVEVRWEDSLHEPQTLPVVFTALSSEKALVRAQAASTLGGLLKRWYRLDPSERSSQMAAHVEQAGPALCQASHDADPQVRLGAAEALGHVSPASSAEGTELLAALQNALMDSTSRAVREAAARALGLQADRLITI